MNELPRELLLVIASSLALVWKQCLALTCTWHKSILYERDWPDTLELIVASVDSGLEVPERLEWLLQRIEDNHRSKYTMDVTHVASFQSNRAIACILLQGPSVSLARLLVGKQVRRQVSEEELQLWADFFMDRAWASWAEAFAKIGIIRELTQPSDSPILVNKEAKQGARLHRMAQQVEYPQCSDHIAVMIGHTLASRLRIVKTFSLDKAVLICKIEADIGLLTFEFCVKV